MTTRYELHVRTWGGCTACELHRTRKSVVLARGRVPADVVFVGEAPGVSEDVLGRPFVGPAGQLLDQVITRAGLDGLVRMAFTNLVCCIPLDPADGKKTAEPPDECVEACGPRLAEFVALARPRLLVCVGKLAEDWLDPGWKKSVKLHDRALPRVTITHPAAVLRAPLAQQGMLLKRMVVTLRDAVARHLGDAGQGMMGQQGQ